MTGVVDGLGMSPLECLAVLGAVALVAARWVPAGQRRVVAAVATAVVVVCGAALLVVGLRWKMLPVFAGAAFALLAVAVSSRFVCAARTATRVSPWLDRASAGVCVGTIAMGPVLAWLLPLPVFPEPSGPHAVGTTVMEWTDADRPETATATDDDRRSVVVQLWYPATSSPPGVERAMYMGRSEEEATIVLDGVADYLGVPRFVLADLARVRSHAVPDAPVVDGGQRFPVVLFSPGLGGTRTQNTAWAEDLASRGYVVAGLDHPYDTAATVVDGRAIRTQVAATGDDDMDRRAAEQRTVVRAEDLRFVLTQLGRLDRGEIPGPLSGRLDTDRAAATGHSLGGAAALLAVRDAPFVAAIDIDGFPHAVDPRPYDQPALGITSRASAVDDDGYVDALDRSLELSSATSYRLDVPNTAHLTFTDAPLFAPPLPGLVGSVGRDRATRLTADITAAFLDDVLHDEIGDVTRRLEAYGEVAVR